MLIKDLDWERISANLVFVTLYDIHGKYVCEYDNISALVKNLDKGIEQLLFYNSEDDDCEDDISLYVDQECEIKNNSLFLTRKEIDGGDGESKIELKFFTSAPLMLS